MLNNVIALVVLNIFTTFAIHLRNKNKYHNGKLYTRPKIVETTDAISTYKLRKMDKVMLHKLFGLG